MSAPLLQVENLSKRFWIGQSPDRGARYLVEKAFRDPLSMFRRLKLREFWALRDLNFSLREGDTLAIIGRNGAGKSTLLKLISRITLPTCGSITLRGRVGSLLEVGTGFHPELTGRENIYLNGALLGMRRAEIRRNFDAIVDFAEVAEFLDTPVKRYSSGMYVRLAFAVAAHLQTELLIVDEVLAVGDARFQKKCLEKMDEVGRAGRTILFVSHNPALLQGFCRQGLLLEAGRQVALGPLDEVLDRYQRAEKRAEAPDGLILDTLPRSAAHTPVLRRLRLLRADNSRPHEFSLGERVAVEVDGLLPSASRHLNLALRLARAGSPTLATLSTQSQFPDFDAPSSSFTARCEFTLPPLLSGPYTLSLELRRDGHLLDELPSVAELHLAPHNFFARGYQPAGSDGPLLLPSDWTLR